MTLKYLGMVESTQIEAITVHMHEVSARHQPFTLGTGALGAFPTPRRARVVWLAVNGNRDALHHLRDDVKRATAAEAPDVFVPTVLLLPASPRVRSPRAGRIGRPGALAPDDEATRSDR